MKASKFLILVFAMVACAQLLIAQEITEKGMIVQGKARVYAPADRAKVSFSIKGVGKSLEAAFDDARLKMDSIASDLYTIGLRDRDIESSFYSGENFGDKSFWSSKKDYMATLSVCITVDSLALLEPALIALSHGDIEGVRNISYEILDFEKLRKDALSEAVRMAKEKADLICEGLGITCDGVIEFEEYRAEPKSPLTRFVYPVNHPNPFNTVLVEEGPDDEGSSGKFGHEFSVDAEVRVLFSIAKPGTKNDAVPMIGEKP